MSELMQEALRLAERGRDRVAPNPMVGCVIVKDGVVSGRGWHEYFGGPHAEINALATQFTHCNVGTIKMGDFFKCRFNASGENPR